MFCARDESKFWTLLIAPLILFLFYLLHHWFAIYVSVGNASENDEEEDESISDVINAVKNRLALQQQYNEDEDEDEEGNHPIHSPDSDL